MKGIISVCDSIREETVIINIGPSTRGLKIKWMLDSSAPKWIF